VLSHYLLQKLYLIVFFLDLASTIDRLRCAIDRLLRDRPIAAQSSDLSIAQIRRWCATTTPSPYDIAVEKLGVLTMPGPES